MTDHIADLLVRIRNASAVNKLSISAPYSKMSEAILTILKNEGYVKNIEVLETDKSAKGEISPVKGGKKTLNFVIAPGKIPSHLKQISKPGQRIYTKGKDIPKPLRGFGLVIVSTSKGVISAKEAAKMGLGGELICEIW